MTEIITKASEIPTAPYYVLATDPFMSGWGMADGKTNTVILPCTSWGEANVCMNQLREYGLKRIRSSSSKPRLNNRSVLYSLCSPDSTPRWYTATTTLRRDSEDYYRVIYGHETYGMQAHYASTFWQAFNAAVVAAVRSKIAHLEIEWKPNDSH